MSERRPYTTKTAAEYLDASPAHVRNLCARGKLRHFRLGPAARMRASAARADAQAARICELVTMPIEPGNPRSMTIRVVRPQIRAC